MNRDSRAVSPVIAVILMVAVTVVLSAAIGAFVFDLGQSTTGAKQQSLGLDTSQSNGQFEVTVVTGSADELQVVLNGNVVSNISNPQPGDSTTVTAQNGDVSIISVRDGQKRVVTTTNINTAPKFNRGLLAYYEFDEDDGSGIAYDAANDNNGLINGASYVSGQIGQALSFNGVDDHVNVTDTDEMNVDNVTVAFWMKSTFSEQTDSSYVTPLGKGRPYIIERDGTNNRVRFSVGINGTRYYAYDSGYFSGDWEFATITYDSTEFRVYHNGELKATNTSMSGPIMDNTYNFTMGSNQHGSNPYSGELDDVRVYNRALSKQEVSDLYNATK